MSQVLSWLKPTKPQLETEIAVNAFTPYCAQIKKKKIIKRARKIHLVPKT